MLAVSVFIIIYLFALENSESALIGSRSNSYIKNKLRNTKELLDRSYSLPYTHNENIIIASRDNFNEIIDKESWKEFWNKSRGASTFNFNDKIIFIKCVKKLKKLLDYRIKLNIEKNWLSLKEIYLDRGKVELGLFGMRDEGIIIESRLIINPVELKNLPILSHIDSTVAELCIAEKNKFFKYEKGYIISGAITINGLVNFQEMSISNLSAMYLMNKKVEHLLISEIDQAFSTELRNLKNFIKNLQLSSICELAFKYWLGNRDDRSENDLRNINLNRYSLYNETVMSIGKVKSTYRVEEININKINGIDMKNVVNSSFFLGNIQAIRGNVRSVIHPFRVMDLRVERINNISSARLLNKVKNDSAGEIAIDRLEVQYLLVDKINEVTVSDAARMSRENVIKGKVRISNLLIRNEIKVQDNVAIPLNNSMQAYEEILIAGNVFVKNVQIERVNSVAIALRFQENNYLNEIKQVSSNEALEQSWRKSEEQMISQSVRFEKGASINQLECQYLNGLREQEFAYSGCSSLKVGNVTFSHAHVIEQSLINGSGSAGGFFKMISSVSSIAFDRSVRFSHLSADRLLLDRYNGISVKDIMHASNDPLQSAFQFDFPPSQFKIVRATDQMHVRQLNIDSLNVRSANNFEKAMISDKTQHLKIDKLGVSAIKMNNVEIKDLCGKNVEGGLLNQQILVKKRRESIVLTVADKLEVQNSFNVIHRRLNEEDLEHYIDSMSSLNVDKVIQRKRIKSMEVFQHLNARDLLMAKLESTFAEALSINSQQVQASSKLIAGHVKADYFSIEKFNKIKASSLIHTDTWPSLIINGSKYFSSLVVKGNVKSKRLKDESATTRKTAEPLKIRGAMLNHQSVHIFGYVFWEDGTSSSSIRSESVKELFDCAVSKSNDQTSICSLVVDRATAIDSLQIVNEHSSLVLNKIFETLSESLIDREDSTASTVSAVTGKKVLKKKVQTRTANVLKSIRTRSINRVRFDQMILQLFQIGKSEEPKNEALENPMTLAKLTFLCELEIESLRTQSNNRESASAHKFALIDKKILPSRLTFKRLMVERNVSLLELDKLDLNKFLNNRINIARPNDILANLQFDRSVIVLTSSSIVELNAVREKDLVFKFIKASALPRAVTAMLIKGKKSFSSILFIERNLDVTSFASNFNDSFFSADNTEIFGNLEIEEDVESVSDILLLGQLNNTGLELKDEKVGESSIEQSKQILTSKVQKIHELVAVEPTNKLSGGLFYFESINDFNLILWPTGVQAVSSKSIDDSSTRFDLYISEAGTFCGLPIDCPCRAHLLLEISLSGKERVVQAKSSNVLFNFYEPKALFGLRVVSEAGDTEGETVQSVRSSEHCTRCTAAVATIFWTKLNAFGETKTEKAAVRIEGFIADAQVFLMNNGKETVPIDKLYMILAKFCDSTLRSYSTDSIVYEFDLESKTVNKCQLIATEGAKVLHVFQVAKSGVYALIGCVKGKAESLLMRFDPITRQLIRTFFTGGSKHIASLSYENKSFAILSNPDIEALQIYIYNVAFDNFYHYQNLYFRSRVSSLNVLYSEDFGQSNTYFTVTTKDGLFYVYQYTFSGKFKMKISHRIEDFQVQSPFRIGDINYLFATHKFNTTIFKVVQDSNY